MKPIRTGLKRAVDTDLRYALMTELSQGIHKDMYLKSRMFRICRWMWQPTQDRLEASYGQETANAEPRKETEHHPIGLNV
jgi:hypothetical protein